MIGWVRSRGASDGALLLAVLLAFYAGFRLPNLWSINYYIPGLFDGFGRRSLLGTLLTPFGNLRFDYWFLVGVQTVVLCVLLGVIVAYALRSGLRIRMLIALFFIAPTGGYLFHTVGYVDEVLYLLLFAALALKDKRISLALLAASLFAHEMAAFTIVPIYLAHLIVTQRTLLAVGHGAVLTGVFGGIYLFGQTVEPAAIEALLQRIKAHGSYPLRLDYYEVFSNEFIGGRVANYHVHAGRRPMTITLLVAAVTALAFVRRQETVRSLAVAGAVLAACLAPLMLGFAAWDVDRWMFLSVSSSILVLCVFEGARSTLAAWTVGALLLLFAAFGQLFFFDAVRPRSILPYPHVVSFVRDELPVLLRTIPQK